AARRAPGISSPRAPDRPWHILEPLGATFVNPLPLLFHHDRAKPVGTAVLTATADAIHFTATLPLIEAAGALRDRVEEAWQSVAAGIIRGVSIGFRPLADGMEKLKSGGHHLVKNR